MKMISKYKYLGYVLECLCTKCLEREVNGLRKAVLIKRVIVSKTKIEEDSMSSVIYSEPNIGNGGFLQE